VSANTHWAKPVENLAIMLIVVTFVACAESRHEIYENIGAARAAGAVTKGWVPEYVPAVASRIQVFYFVDSPEAWLSADCSEQCIASITREAESYAGQLPPSPRTSRLLWPVPEAIKTGGVQLRRHPSGGLILLDAAQRSVYFYHRVQSRDGSTKN
jgi:hypothetical protein